MSRIATSRLKQTSRSEISRLAVRAAVAVGLVAIFAGLVLGRGLEQSVSGGVAVALSGLLAWTTYHLASRRDDGLLYLAMPTPSIFMGDHYRGFWPSTIICACSLMPVAWLFGIMARRTGAKEAVSERADRRED